MALVQLRREDRVVERGLDGALAVIEVAAHAEDAHVVPVLRHHLLALDVRDTVGGIEHHYVRVLAVRETLEGRLAGVARRRDEDQVVVRLQPPGPASLHGLTEEEREALQRHVLEGARGPVPELENERAGYDLFDGCDALVSPLLTICLAHECVDAGGRDVDAEPREHRGRASPVRHGLEGQDLRQCELGQLVGHV